MKAPRAAKHARGTNAAKAEEAAKAKRLAHRTPAVRPVAPARVGVRELRQNLSVYLERVIGGERLEVTDRGHPVAMLIPLLPAATLVERLVAEGRAIPARVHFNDVPMSDVDLPPDFGARVQRALQELREDSR